MGLLYLFLCVCFKIQQQMYLKQEQESHHHISSNHYKTPIYQGFRTQQAPQSSDTWRSSPVATARSFPLLLLPADTRVSVKQEGILLPACLQQQTFLSLGKFSFSVCWQVLLFRCSLLTAVNSPPNTLFVIPTYYLGIHRAAVKFLNYELRVRSVLVWTSLYHFIAIPQHLSRWLHKAIQSVD